MHRVNLSVKQVLGFAIIGLKSGRHDATLDLLQDCYDQLPGDEECPEVCPHCDCIKQCPQCGIDGKC
jgi:hypothetical protein